MSWRVLGLVFDRRFPSPCDKFVMLALAEWGGDDGVLRFPCSKAQLADTTQYSTRQLQRCLGEFVKQGLLEIVTFEHAASKTARTYRINLARLAGLPLTETAKAKRARLNSAQRGDTVSLQGETESPDTGDAVAQRGDTVSQGEDSVSPNIPLTPHDSLLAPDCESGQATSESHETCQRTPRETDPEAMANETWNAASDAIMDEIGEKAMGAWLKEALPISDDGTRLELGLPSKFMAGEVAQRFREMLERHTKRQLKIVVRNRSVHETTKRLAKKKREAAAAREAGADSARQGKTGGQT